MGYILGFLLVLLIIYLLPTFLMFALGAYIIVVVVNLVRNFLYGPRPKQNRYTQTNQQERYNSTQSRPNQTRNSDIIDVEYTEHEVDDE